MKNFGLFVLRATLGSLLAGHGAQKLWGVFGGHGIEGTGGFMESLGLKPGKQWAMLSGGTEFGGGVLTALGFLNPLGPIGIISAMAVASIKVHWNKPIWASAGGAELAVVNAAGAAAIALAGPGAISVDRVLGTKTPKWMVGLALLGSAAGIANAVQSGFAQPPPAQEEEGAEVQAGEDANQ